MRRKRFRFQGRYVFLGNDEQEVRISYLGHGFIVHGQVNRGRLPSMYAGQTVGTDEDTTSYRSWRIEDYIGVVSEKLLNDLAILSPI
jgi:hypothetical protein